MDIHDEPGLYGAKFLRLCDRLPLYEGALRRRLEMEAQEESQEGGGTSYDYEVDDDDPQFTRGQSMSMGEALARSQNDDTAVLHALNKEGANSQFGPLFEYGTA